MATNNLRLFQAAVAAHILGKKTNVHLHGTSEKVTITKNVISASKDLYEELNDPSTNIEKISELLDKKRVASKQFLEAVGTPWLL